MSEQIFDIAIIGAGPAGLSAALTARVRNKSVALFEHMDFSPKLQKAHAINNYLGMPMTAGKDMMKQMADHCLAAGPTLIREKVTNIYAGDTFTLLTPVLLRLISPQHSTLNRKKCSSSSSVRTGTSSHGSLLTCGCSQGAG